MANARDTGGVVFGVTFEEYVRQRGAALVRLARLLARDRDLGDDLAQEVLARAFVRWRTIVATGHPERYLRRMLVNAHITQWRRYGSRVVPSMVLDDRQAGGDTAVEQAERQSLWQLIVDLPPRQRATVVLRYYEDLDDAEIAEILDCSPVTVRGHAKRALDKLRERLVSGAARRGSA